MAYGLLLGLSTLGYLIVTNQLDSYPVLLSERESFEIHFTADAEQPNQTMVRLLSVSGTSSGDNKKQLDTQWPIQGTQWRLTTRVLVLPGLTPRARLYRLITGIDEESTSEDKAPQRAYVLSEIKKPDLWRFLHKRLSRNGLKTTEMISTDFIPIEAGKRYRVALTDSHIILRELTADNAR